MKTSTVSIGGHTLEVRSCAAAVVGSGAAGLNAADQLFRQGVADILLVTEGWNAGTSRNTGSDKQTYYKLTLAGGEPDSVGDLAETLFAGGCMDGDHALAEAAHSAQCFYRLVELGIPFPRGRYGDYAGYKTDHDPHRRATSAGPYTSKLMTEALGRAVREKQIPVLDRLQVIRVLTLAGRLWGLLGLDLGAPEPRFLLLRCEQVIFATGGPAGMYADSAFPHGHYGSTGLALEAGAKGKNLTEWQYGLASLRPRWNVSGTYMQALPRFFSTDEAGGNPREFLGEYFRSRGEMLSMVFLKGYQWPFDVRKVQSGSSLIDLAVYVETALRGRRVFLDFRENPGGEPVDFGGLSPEAGEYLAKAGALLDTPLRRLAHMNPPAVEFYRDKGVDLAAEPLEIALCAQHNNGGLAVDRWWQTGLPGLFAAGEAAGTHGVYRPGGSALNSGQVGSLRAAAWIAAHPAQAPALEEALPEAVRGQVAELLALASSALARGGDPREEIRRAQRRMSSFGAAIRSREGVRGALEETKGELENLPRRAGAASPAGLGPLFRLRDILLAQTVYLSAMLDYLEQGGGSRGSALYTDPAGEAPPGLPELFRFRLEDGGRAGQVQEAALEAGMCRFTWRPVRPIPQEDGFFENVWRSYRENGNVD